MRTLILFGAMIGLTLLLSPTAHAVVGEVGDYGGYLYEVKAVQTTTNGNLFVTVLVVSPTGVEEIQVVEVDIT